MKRTITLEIAGTKFRLVSDADQEHLQRLAAMISARVEKMGGAGSRSASSGQLLALVALELADELEGAAAKLQQMEQMTRTAVAHAIARIDSRLASTPKIADDDPR